ncbi:MAG: hypothetical protein FJ241_12470 [Nitrospira sp.]|nr:hypothetical protein [Nitrospira sp.]
MDVNNFLILLLKGFSKLDFVEKIDVQTEVFVPETHSKITTKTIEEIISSLVQVWTKLAQ